MGNYQSQIRAVCLHVCVCMSLLLIISDKLGGNAPSLWSISSYTVRSPPFYYEITACYFTCVDLFVLCSCLLVMTIILHTVFFPLIKFFPLVGIKVLPIVWVCNLSVVISVRHYALKYICLNTALFIRPEDNWSKILKG